MRLIASVQQRWEDFKREQRIAGFAALAQDAYDRGLFNASRSWLLDMAGEINARSPEQVARLERARGLR
jgi:hypothetical protein